MTPRDQKDEKQPETAPVAPRPDLSGSTFGRYSVIAKIGQGGMGVVYEAYEESLDRRVALKLLPPQLTEDEEWSARFTREAQMAAKLEHPAIASIYGIDRSEDGQLYIAMQYVEGIDLGCWLRELGKLPLEVALKITRETALALGEAHKQQIIHRDIKPDNLRLEPSGRVKVMDFGLARDTQVGKGPRITEVGIFLGTPEYCSPEQCEAGHVDQRSDLYALGVCLYEMLTGSLPHAAETPYSLFKKIVEEEPLRVRELDASIPKGIDQILQKLMAKKPAQRYATAEALVADLDREFDPQAVDLAAYYAQVDRRLNKDNTSHQTVAFRPGVDADETTMVAGLPRRAPIPAPVGSAAAASRPNRTLGVAVVLLLALIGGVAGLLSQSPELMPLLAASPLSDDLPLPTLRAQVVSGRLAILEFADGQPSAASAGFNWLKNGLPEMLGINLSQLNGIEVVPFSQVRKTGLAETQGAVDPLAVARKLGAGLVLVGKYILAGDRLVIYATLHTSRDGELKQVAGKREDGSSAQFLQVIDKLSTALTPLFEKSGVLAMLESGEQGYRGKLNLTRNLRAASRQLLTHVQQELRPQGASAPASPSEAHAPLSGSLRALPALKARRRQDRGRLSRNELPAGREVEEADDDLAEGADKQLKQAVEKLSQAKGKYFSDKAGRAPRTPGQSATGQSGTGKNAAKAKHPQKKVQTIRKLKLGETKQDGKRQGGKGAKTRKNKKLTSQAVRTNRAWACFFKARHLSLKGKRNITDLTQMVKLLKQASALAPDQFKACSTQLLEIEAQIVKIQVLQRKKQAARTKAAKK